MSQIQQVLNYVKSINERLNLWAQNAKKAEELPEMNPMNPAGLLMVSELEGGVYKSKRLTIQKIIEGISIDSQDNKVREVLLGSITETHDLAYLLDNNGITVTESEIVVLTALATINNTLVQKQYLWKKGKGDYNPIGSTDINSKLIELQPKFINEIIADELTNSPQAIVYDFGVITDAILTVLNTASPARNYTDENKIYYVRATKDGVNLLYNFVGTNGIYGAGNLQMVESDLVVVYSSSNADLTDFFDLKTDKGGFPGTAQDLDNTIKAIQFPDGVTEIGTIVKTGNEVSIAADEFEWRINQVLYTNAALFTTTIAAATDGYNRIDILVGNNLGGIEKIQGVESIDVAIKPDVPVGKVEITFIAVFGAEISTPTMPITGDKFVLKIESDGYLIKNAGANVFARIPADGRKLIIFNNPGLVSISGFDLQDVQNNKKANKPYQGVIFRLSNETGVDVLLKHMASYTGQKMPFNLKGGVDMIFPDKGHITFHYNFGASIELNEEFKSWGSDAQDLSPYETIVNNDAKLDLKVDKDGIKQLSDENYTTSEKSKLASIDATHYLAPVQSLANLSAKPQASLTDKARVYVENDLSDYFYDATAVSGDIAPDDQSGGIGFWRKVAVGGETPTSIKSKYESLPDTNAYTDADQTKVATIDQAVSTTEKTTWNAKEPAITADVVTKFWSGLKTWRDLATDVLAVVLGTYAKGAGTVSATDTIKGAIQKLDGNVDGKANKYGTRTVLSGTVIDWGADTDTYTKTLTQATAVTDVNLPQGTNTKTIAMTIDGAFPFTVPAYWKHKGGVHSTTKSNQYVLQCVNGNAGSERVNYIINPDL